jgi:hypothetical protein
MRFRTRITSSGLGPDEGRIEEFTMEWTTKGAPQETNQVPNQELQPTAPAFRDSEEFRPTGRPAEFLHSA